MADFTLDQCGDVDEFGLDGFVPYYIDETDGSVHSYNGSVHSYNGPAAKTCRCCGRGGLHWKQLRGKWRLFTGAGALHVCPVNPLKD
jgi:hypothetical protein